MTAYVYMIRCANGHLYTGWTNDLAARLEAHRSGRGARYTRSFRAVSLVYYETVADRSEALRRKKRPWWSVSRAHRRRKANADGEKLQFDISFPVKYRGKDMFISKWPSAGGQCILV